MKIQKQNRERTGLPLWGSRSASASVLSGAIALLDFTASSIREKPSAHQAAEPPALASIGLSRLLKRSVILGLSEPDFLVNAQD